MELSAHLVAAVSNGMMVENIFGGNLPDYGIAADNFKIHNARISLSQVPGHGVVFDQKALRIRELANDAVIERASAVHAGV